MDKPRTTPKDFFLWAGAMLALYVSAVSFISLLFNYINYAFPSPTAYYPLNPYQSGISYEMASLIILFPLFLFLYWLIHRDIRRDDTRAHIWVRRWALMLTLFVAGATIAVDLIVLLTSFFNGEELTLAFILKVVVVALVAAAGFMHFIADLWGYWEKEPARSKMVGWATGALIALTIVAGFFIIGTPAHARLLLLDQQKVNDLQSIQSQITYYYQAHRTLPQSLDALNNALTGYSVPLDQQTGEPYTYQPGGQLSFEMCATFNAPSQAGQTGASVPQPMGLGPSGKNFDNWAHGAGNTCFTRTIDPALYPPLSKPLQ